MERTPSRRRFLRIVGAGALAGAAGCGSAPRGTDGARGSSETPTPVVDGTSSQTADGTASTPEVSLEPVATGLRAPLDIAFPVDSPYRYVAEQQGVVHVYDGDGRRDRPFLDLREAVEAGGEKGLLGLALHPEFAENRRVFVRYSAPPRPGTPSDYSHTFVLAEYRANADGTRVRAGSERAILEIPEPQWNHNAGDLAFGPDGYLYVTVGDGGGGGDQGAGHVSDWYDGVPGGNGQDVTENLLGSILRIDVDAREGGKPYAVPSDNPLVGRPGLDEHYAWGFRNPWRMSFDGADLYVGDVGQNRYEEVDLVERGGNYGWNVREGTHCYGASSCPDETPPSVRGGEPLRDPIVEYPHSGEEVSGISVIGGYVYRGSALPGLRGVYVFGDLQAEGRLFVARPSDGNDLWPTRVLPVGDGLDRLLSLGRDRDDELYALGTGPDGGAVFRLVPA